MRLLTNGEQQALSFHRMCKRLAKDSLCDLAGSDHKASTVTLRYPRGDKNAVAFTVPFWWLDTMIDYYRSYM